MKNIIVVFFAIVILSCNSNSKSEGQADGENVTADNRENAELVPHPMIDNKGQIMGQMTFPANWKLHNEPGQAAFTGPDGISVYNIPMRNFVFTNNEMTRQAYQQNGGQLRQPVSAETIIQQDFVPIAQREGSKLISVQSVPDIAKSDGTVQDMMYRIGPPNTKYEAVISEWEDSKGNPYAIVLHVSYSEIGDMMMWNYYGHGLDAPKSGYDSAKKTLINGLASLQYNPRYFDQYNKSEMQKESASWAAHNQKMSAQQRQFDAQQAAFKQKNDAINQSITDNYNSKNAASDRNHNRFLNYIKDENTVANPVDGQRYQVQSGANNYWMNENGQYISTDDPNYDPNRNQNTNNENSNEVQVTD